MDKDILIKRLEMIEDCIEIIKEYKEGKNTQYESIASTNSYTALTNAKMWINKIIHDDF